MSTQEYNSERILSVDDGLSHLGFTEAQIANMSDEKREQYTNWVKESNNKVETALVNFSDALPLPTTSQEYSYAKLAALDWVVYKKRDLAGSSNAKTAKEDYETNIAAVIELLKKRPTSRTYPIDVEVTDSTANIIRPYSQTQGLPDDILW